MKHLLAIALLFAAAPIVRAAPAFGKLVMTGPNSARVEYQDKCANGANNDDATQGRFVKAMLAQPKSRLAQLRRKLLRRIGADRRGEGVYFDDPMPTYHDRDGCGTSHNSASLFVYTVTGGNTNHTVVRYLVTIDDDDDGGVRTLSLRSIQPLKIRDEKF